MCQEKKYPSVEFKDISLDNFQILIYSLIYEMINKKEK